MKHFLAAVAFALTCGGALAAGQMAHPGGAPKRADTSWIPRQFHDIAYGRLPAQQLDLYLPNDDAGPGPYPVVIAIHGGAFMFGDKVDRQLTAPVQSVTHGFAVVALNYRLSGEAPFPAAVQDVKAAVRFLRAHAGEYHLDPHIMIAWGNSAGANLAAMLGTTGHTRQFDDPALGNMEQSSTVQGVVDWYGPIYFDLMDSQFKQSGKGAPNHGAADSAESKYLGATLASMPQQVQAASPATYATADVPPFFIEHGTADDSVPAEQSTMFAAALGKVAGRERVQLTLLPGANHGGPEFETDSNMDSVLAFLDRVAHPSADAPKNPAR